MAMPRLKAANLKKTTLSTSCNPGDTTIQVTDPGGFPAPPFRIFLGTAQEYEIMEVTAVSGSTWTVSRGQENTTPKAWPAGTNVENRFTAGYYSELISVDEFTWDNLGGKPQTFPPSPHANTHVPTGSDPLPTGAPSGGLGTANQEGSSSTFARSDHVHQAFDNVNPEPVGTLPSPGTSLLAARRDHVHTLGHGVVGTANIQDGAVTTSKIQDGAVTTAKIQDGAVTDAKISGRLSLGKLPTSAVVPRVLAILVANGDPEWALVLEPMIADNAVTDSKIGERTISDANAPTGNTAQLTTLLGWLANRIKAAMGTASWRDDPGITLVALVNHKTRHAIGGADPLTPADIGAVAKSGDTMQGILVAFPNTQYTTPQMRNIILSTADPSGGNNGDVWLKYV